MIEDREFWECISEYAPNAVSTRNALLIALNRATSRNGVTGGVSRRRKGNTKAVATAQVIRSPAAQSPNSAVANTPLAGGDLSTTHSTQLLPSQGVSPAEGASSRHRDALHEPFLSEETGSTSDRWTAVAPGEPFTGEEVSASTPVIASTVATKQQPRPSASCRAGGATKSSVPDGYDFASGIKPCAIRLLQHTMMFMVPMYNLRYRIPAMSMSWSAVCAIDADTKRLVTFGALSANVPVHLKLRGCVCGDDYIAVLSETDEVWVSGSLDNGNGPQPTPGLQPPPDAMSSNNMRGIATKIRMMSGHGSRLLSLTKAMTVRPLSIVPVNTRTMIPSRLVRFVEVGVGDDCYMIGLDSVLYKTTISHRNVTTPRRVMTLARLPVSRIGSGSGFHLILDEMGQLHTLGKNKKGQLGNKLKQDSMRRPYRVAYLSKHFLVQSAAGEVHSLVLASSGEVYACGSNENGQLGLGSQVTEVSEFTLVPLPGPCAAIAAGPIGSMFALRDGRLFMCGANDHQQLGLGPSSSALKIVHRPTAIPKTILSKGVLLETLGYDMFYGSRNGSEFAMLSPSTEAMTLLQQTSAASAAVAQSSGTGTNRSSNKSVLPRRGGKDEKQKSNCKNCCTLM